MEAQYDRKLWYYMRGHSFEAGIQVSFQPLRFLAVQAEALFTNDIVSFRYGEILESGGLPFNRDAYDSYSMLFPLTIKGTFHLYDRLALNPFAGVYFMAPLGTITGMEKELPTSDNGTNNPEITYYDTAYTYSPPIGWTAGLEIGAVLGKERNRGTVFLDLRYSADLGDVVLSGDTEISRADVRYQRMSEIYHRAGMVSITAGYRFGFFKRNRPAPVREELPEDFDIGSFNGG